MTAIRDPKTGTWSHGTGRENTAQVPVTFFRVGPDFADGNYRRERIVHIPSIEQVQVRGTGIKVYVANDPEPLRLFDHEYEQLVEHLESSGAMLTLGTGAADV